jgi:hypothetical protein
MKTEFILLTEELKNEFLSIFEDNDKKPSENMQSIIFIKFRIIFRN